MDLSLLPFRCDLVSYLLTQSEAGSVETGMLGVEEMVTLTHWWRILQLPACLANLLLTERTFAKRKSSTCYLSRIILRLDSLFILWSNKCWASFRVGLFVWPSSD